VTSDTLDARSPIPLTRTDLHVRRMLSLMFVLCNLSARQRLAHTVR
jgi:hypothetical protein